MNWYSSDYDNDVTVVIQYYAEGMAIEPIDMALTRATTKPIEPARLRYLQEEMRVAAAQQRRR